ncbi:uncharacterized protein LOC123708689 [Pieris brassicae]|uniref:Uncharacterized protein n=1 Tax=Pieris brassicae TaxID=7116 RepID=A0A9P0X051_PIEBR|nr:uncharacterized protein LOC123708689 [Pieris brassicae]CAH3913384.1 unnamed protein product [Pieris brassicae]
MDSLVTLFLAILILDITSSEDNATVLYYYGLEESERGMPRCGQGQACSALVARYWRPRALLRLCRCTRRQRCDTPASPDRLMELNNRAYLQFCSPVSTWPECNPSDSPLHVETSHKIMNPDEIEQMHHQNIQLTPPKITLSCRCRYPNYWKIKTEVDNNATYHCSSLPLCKSNDFCGNVDNHLLSLYQSCLCPKNHICVHNGGVAHIQITELLYQGLGWKAFCQPISDDYSYEDN